MLLVRTIRVSLGLTSVPLQIIIGILKIFLKIIFVVIFMKYIRVLG